MAYTTIDKGESHFNAVLTTGTGSSQAVTGVGFQPDFIWGKRRDSSGHHTLFDSVRGITKGLEPSNGTNAEFTSTDYYSSFDSDGFTIAAGASGAGNGSSQTAVQWCWKAASSNASNSNGDVTSTVRANTTSGFSIVKWTAPGSGSAINVGHGLGAVPKVLITKSLGSGSSITAWYTYFSVLGNSKTAYLNNTDAPVSNSNIWGATTPTSTVFKHNSGSDNIDYIAYCFAEIKGFSKFGSYVGNGNSNGPMVYTGFKPAFVLQKNTSATQGWQVQDNERNGFNPDNDLLQPHTNQSESNVDRIDILSNGFKVRNTDAGQNSSGVTYLYMAFAEHPFVSSSGTPTTAR